MAEAIKVQFAGTLERFIHERVEERKWGWLREELNAGAEADEAEFAPLDVAALLLKARTRRDAHG